MQIILMHSLYPSEIGDFVVTSCRAGDTGFYAHHDYLRCADGGTHIPVGECRFTFLAKYPASQRPAQRSECERPLCQRNLAAMAVKLGEMQAQLMARRLGERVQGLAGVKPEEFNFKELPARGGPGNFQRTFA
jgi:hypothetical protein